MMKYTVTFTKYYSYDIDATSESEAEDEAYQQFCSDMHSPVASTWYDEVEIECEEDELCMD